LLKLFELEVPEIADGVVKVHNVAREPGHRAKIAVESTDSRIDPVGACVGNRGCRVQNIVHELHGEKIDIIPWSEDPAKFVCAAIAPAEVSELIVDEDNQSMELIIDDSQLSLAIGKKGQNVRLAAKLTTWKIDIRSKSKYEENAKQRIAEMMKIAGMDEVTAEALCNADIASIESLAEAAPDDVSEVLHVDDERARDLLKRAAAALETCSEAGPDAASEPPPADMPEGADGESRE
jgi:N utilization substance protein A